MYCDTVTLEKSFLNEYVPFYSRNILSLERKKCIVFSMCIIKLTYGTI